jgi:teichoic acid transport system permease protein
MRSAKIGSPGQLVGAAVASEAEETDALQVEPTDGSLAALAASYGLKPSAERPTIGRYLRELAHRWSFIIEFATARNISLYTGAKLGQLWQVLSPLLNAGVYALIFGLIIKGVSRGVPNYLPFLVTGVFVFSFTQRTFITTSKVITESLPLIRALQFPRAALPLAYVMIELQQLALSMAVLFIIVLATGEPITWYWLLLIPALALQVMFSAGIGLFAARVGARVNDFAQLLPFLMRTWLYLSGVLFSVQQLVLEHASHQWAIDLLQLNPASVYITLARDSLLTSQRQSAFGAKQFNAAKCQAYLSAPNHNQYNTAYCHPTFISSHLWEIGAGWAVLALLFGFWFFWRKEVNYGRG